MAENLSREFRAFHYVAGNIFGRHDGILAV
jgi:hypothetical protein